MGKTEKVGTSPAKGTADNAVAGGSFFSAVPRLFLKDLTPP